MFKIIDECTNIPDSSERTWTPFHHPLPQEESIYPLLPPPKKNHFSNHLNILFCCLFSQILSAFHFRFLCQASSMDFLSKQNFDFNKLFKEGISYLKSDDERKLMDSLQEKREMRRQSTNQVITVRILIMDYSGIQIVDMCPIAKLSGIQTTIHLNSGLLGSYTHVSVPYTLYH